MSEPKTEQQSDVYDSRSFVARQRTDLELRGFSAAAVRDCPLTKLLQRRLADGFESALSNHPGSRHTLRTTVLDASHELMAAGYPPPLAAQTIIRFCTAHPDLHRLDRISVIDGRRWSDQVFAWMNDWVIESSNDHS